MSLLSVSEAQDLLECLPVASTAQSHWQYTAAGCFQESGCGTYCFCSAGTRVRLFQKDQKSAKQHRVGLESGV